MIGLIMGVLSTLGSQEAQFTDCNANVGYFASETAQNEEEIESEIASVEPYEEKMAAGGIVTEYVVIEAVKEYKGTRLTKSAGKVQGPYASETWYNLPMGRCIDMMRDLGYTTEDYPYWVRSDGTKMLGEYIMVAANTHSIPKGTIVETSLGMGIVADHCVRAESENLIDLAVTW